MKELTPAASLAWQVAALETDGGGHERIERGHMLIGILSLEKFRDATPADVDVLPDLLAGIRQEIGRIDEVLARAEGKASTLRRALRAALGRGTAARGRRSISRSDGCKQAFALAAERSGGAPVSSLHLLSALAAEPDDAISQALRDGNVEVGALAEAALSLAGVRADAPAPPPVGPRAAAAVAAGTPELDRYGRDLTAMAARGLLGPVVGRRDVLLELLQTLARSSKNNPLLVGEAGVGKTAVVEALAIRAAQGKDPAVLGGRRIVELNVGALLAGTEYRGAFEERLTKILKEVAARPEVVVFIDELHVVVGAGRVGQGGADAASLLKPALARGEFRCIGATTLDDYRRHIEPDAALERRFARIDVPEPTCEETVEILHGLRGKWERHHGVRIEDAALQAAVDLSVRFDPEHRLPDKAVDLVDKAGARARVPMLSILRPEDAGGPRGGPAAACVPVTPRLVAEVLAEKRGLPLDLLVAGTAEAKRLLDLEPYLRQRLIGQEQAIARVSQRLRLAHAGLTERRGPLAVFLFLGPTGVGKTELARLLAEFLFGSASELTRLDMSEFMEQHAVSKLIGAPPGYVGHEEEGQLTGALRARPYSVVLLDEVEKAHPRIFDVFLQLFDEGRLTDVKGRLADGRRAIFVMTSNLGTTTASEAVVGFAGVASDAGAAQAVEEARRFFRPELLGRVDEVVVFRPLDGEAVRRIARPILERLAETVRQKHGVTLEITPEAEGFLAEAGFSARAGARELARTVERLVQAPLAGLVLSGKLAQNPVWRVVYDEGGVYLLPG